MKPPRPNKSTFSQGGQQQPASYYAVADVGAVQVHDARFELRGARLVRYTVGDLAKQLLGARIHA